MCPSDFTAKDYWLQSAPVCALYHGNLGGLCLMPCIREQRILCVQLNLLYQSHLVPTDLKTDSNTTTVALHQESAGQGCTRLSQQKLQAENSIGSKKPPRAACVVCQHRNKSLLVPLSTHHLSYFLPLGSSNSAKFISLGHV